MGFRVVEACNGLEAAQAALREKPQLILMESRLPFIDGRALPLLLPFMPDFGAVSRGSVPEPRPLLPAIGESG